MNSLSDAQAEQQEWRDALNAPLILNLDDLDEATQRVLLNGLRVPPAAKHRSGAIQISAVPHSFI